MLNTLSGSFQVSPMFFLNWGNMVNYNIVAQTPQYKMDTMQDLRTYPSTGQDEVHREQVHTGNPEILSDLASVAADTRWRL